MILVALIRCTAEAGGWRWLLTGWNPIDHVSLNRRVYHVQNVSVEFDIISALLIFEPSVCEFNNVLSHNPAIG